MTIMAEEEASGASCAVEHDLLAHRLRNRTHSTFIEYIAHIMIVMTRSFTCLRRSHGSSFGLIFICISSLPALTNLFVYYVAFTR